MKEVVEINIIVDAFEAFDPEEDSSPSGFGEFIRVYLVVGYFLENSQFNLLQRSLMLEPESQLFLAVDEHNLNILIRGLEDVPLTRGKLFRARRVILRSRFFQTDVIRFQMC